MEVDILAIGAHPDDVELCCSGTILKHIKQGYKVGILDLTQGELGTRGNAEIRLKEAGDAANVLRVTFRKNIGIPDGFFNHSRENILKIVKVIRDSKPDIILTNAPRDRHPDHGRASKLVSDASFIAGLSKVETFIDQEKAQSRWRPKAVYHFLQDRFLDPDLVIDITPFIETKMQAILAFRSQFYDPDSDEPTSPISGKDFLEFLKARAREMGRLIGVEYGEGFVTERACGVEDLLSLS